MYQYIAIALSCMQLIASSIPVIRLLLYRSKIGFAVDYQILHLIALILHYQPTEVMIESKLPVAIIVTYTIQCWFKQSLLITVQETFVILALVFPNMGYDFEERPNIKWIIGGVIVSVVLGINLAGSSNSDLITTCYTSGLYLEAVALIPQFKLTLKKTHIDWPVLLYIASIFIYDLCTLGGLTHDYYRNKLLDNVGFIPFALKSLLCCGFFLKYLCKHLDSYRLTAQTQSQGDNRSSQANNPIEV